MPSSNDNQARLHLTYADLLGEDATRQNGSGAALLPLVGDLDRLLAPYRLASPPSELSRSIDLLAREMASNGSSQKAPQRFWQFGAFGGRGGDRSGPPSPHQRGDGSQPTEPPRRRSLGRELAGIAAVILILVLVGAALVAVFRGQGSSSSTLSAGSGSASSIPREIRNTPLALKLYQAGLGVPLNKSVKRGSDSLTLQWVYADAHQVWAAYTSQSPAGASCGSGALSIEAGGKSPTFEGGNAVGGPESGTLVDCLISEDVDFTSEARLGLVTLEDSSSLKVSASVPILPVREVTLHQRSTLNGKSLILDRVSVTPTSIRLYLSGEATTENRFANSPVIVNGLLTGNSNAPGTQARTPPSGDFVYSTEYSDPGWTKSWTVQVLPVGATGPVAADLSRAASFTFTLPPASWDSKLSPAATPAATPASLTASARYAKLPPNFVDDPGAQAVYKEGLGKHVDLTYQNNGYTWTIQWVYADPIQLIAYYTIKPPSNESGLHISSELNFVDASGHEYLAPFIIDVPADSDGEAHFLTWVPWSQSKSSDSSSLALQLKLSDIDADLLGKATPARQEGTVAHGGTINVTVPFEKGQVVPVNQHGQVAGIEVGLDHLLLAPSGMQAFFSYPKQPVGSAQALPPLIVELTTGQGGYTRLRPWDVMSGLSGVVFTSPPPKTLTGTWSISVEPPESNFAEARDPSNWLTFTFLIGSADNSAIPVATPKPTPAPSPTAVTHGPAVFSQQDIKDSTAFDIDAGAQRVVKAGMGTFMGKSEKVGQTTVDVRWAYADLNEISVFYTVRNRAPDPTGNQEIASLSTCPPIDVRLSPKSLYSNGESGGIDISRAQGGLVGCLLNIYTDIHQGMPQPGTTIEVELDGNLGYRDHLEPKANFNINLSLTLQPALIATSNQARMLGGKPVKLGQVVITPTRIAFTVTGAGESNAQNEPSPTITINGWSGANSNDVPSGNIDPSAQLVNFTMNCPPEAFPKSGTWTIVIYANDQYGKTIKSLADAAVFTVNLPPAPWSQPQVVVPSPTP